MLTRKLIVIAAVAAIVIMTAGVAAAENEAKKDYGVFEYVVVKAQGSAADIVTAIETAATEGGWKVAASVDAGVPGDCKFGAHVVILYDETYAAAVMKPNPATGPYAVLDRINVFEDENGTHVSVVNPHSITRTVLMDDTGFETQAEDHLQALRAMIAGAVTGTASEAQYGQIRSEGHIGKTMGVVAGGKFGDLIKVKAEVEGTDVAAVAAKVRKDLSEKSKKWGMATVLEIDMSEFGIVLFATTGTPMDSKSFDIVKSGTDEARKDFACPGIAHAAAYPIELVVSKSGDKVTVSMVEAMFRMKMFFEDAGKWAFMNNMKMPGSIDKDLKKQIKAGLEND